MIEKNKPTMLLTTFKKNVYGYELLNYLHLLNYLKAHFRVHWWPGHFGNQQKNHTRINTLSVLFSNRA